MVWSLAGLDTLAVPRLLTALWRTLVCTSLKVMDLGVGVGRLGAPGAFLLGRISTQVCTAETGSFGDRETDLGSSLAPPLCSLASVQVQHFTGSGGGLSVSWGPRPLYPLAPLFCQLGVILGVIHFTESKLTVDSARASRSSKVPF